MHTNRCTFHFITISYVGFRVNSVLMLLYYIGCLLPGKSEAATSSDKASLDDHVADSTATISTPTRINGENHSQRVALE